MTVTSAETWDMAPVASWIVSEANAGLRSQAVGLADALGLKPEIRDIVPTGVWRHVPASLWPGPLDAVTPKAARPSVFAGPLPELLIGCGGKAAAVLAAVSDRARTVIVQHPRMDPRRFDLVLVAQHDRLAGPNVIVTRTALHRVTRARLDAAAMQWAGRLATLPRPLVAVLVGGANGRFRLDVGVAERLCVGLAEMMREDGAGLVVTPSRRTPPAVRQVLTERLSPLGARVWDGTGENPYLGMLALADAIVVTQDSVSMVSEAVATRVPVMVVPLPGRSRRIGLFLHGLAEARRIRRFAGRLEQWPVMPIDDTADAAAEVGRRLGWRMREPAVPESGTAG